MDFHISPQPSIIQNSCRETSSPKFWNQSCPWSNLKHLSFSGGNLKKPCVWSCHKKLPLAPDRSRSERWRKLDLTGTRHLALKVRRTCVFFLHATECQETKGRYRAEIDKKGTIDIVVLYISIKLFVDIKIHLRLFFCAWLRTIIFIFSVNKGS